MMTETHEAAREYHRMGLPITLCAAGSKKPYTAGWPTKKWTLKEIDAEFRARGDLNVGTRLGPAAKIIDIEFDAGGGDEALADLFGGDVPVTPTFASTRSPHRLFAWHPDLAAVGKASIPRRRIGNPTGG